MRRQLVLRVLIVVGIGIALPAFAGDSRDTSGRRQWWRGERKEEFWNGPCEVKLESKQGEFKREVKCKDGVGARWRGEGKEEFRDGPCTVKRETTREVYKEEVKCEADH